jgi:hypothetical protein
VTSRVQYEAAGPPSARVWAALILSALLLCGLVLKVLVDGLRWLLWVVGGGA